MEMPQLFPCFDVDAFLLPTYHVQESRLFNIPFPILSSLDFTSRYNILPIFPRFHHFLFLDTLLFLLQHENLFVDFFQYIFLKIFHFDCKFLLYLLIFLFNSIYLFSCFISFLYFDVLFYSFSCIILCIYSPIFILEESHSLKRKEEIFTLGFLQPQENLQTTPSSLPHFKGWAIREKGKTSTAITLYDLHTQRGTQVRGYEGGAKFLRFTLHSLDLSP